MSVWCLGVPLMVGTSPYHHSRLVEVYQREIPRGDHGSTLDVRKALLPRAVRRSFLSNTKRALVHHLPWFECLLAQQPPC